MVILWYSKEIYSGNNHKRAGVAMAHVGLNKAPPLCAMTMGVIGYMYLAWPGPSGVVRK